MNSIGVIQCNGIPSLGNLIGTSGSDNLLKTINNEMRNSDFFGSINDIMQTGRQMFVANFVEPIRSIGNTIKNVIGMTNREDEYISITSSDMLRSIPTCMHLPILMYKPVRKLFDDGRIFGFGHQTIPDEDPYGRLIKNGTIDDLAEAMDDNGIVEFSYEFKSTDPDLTFDQLESIRETREFLEEFLRTNDEDPTDYPNTKA